MGGEKRPGIDCLRMRDHSQKNLGIRLRLETVGKINTYTSDIITRVSMQYRELLHEWAWYFHEP